MLVIWFPAYALPVRGLVRVRPGTPEKSPLAHAAGTVWVSIREFWAQTHTFIVEVEEGVILV